MHDWDSINAVIIYMTNEYPVIDITTSKKQNRQREYERLIIDELLFVFLDGIIENPIDILEKYEMVHEYLNAAYNNDIYLFQLNVIKKLLLYLRERSNNDE